MLITFVNGGIIYLCMLGIVCIFVLLKRNSQVTRWKHVPKHWNRSAKNLKQRSICFNQCADGYYHRFESCPDYKNKFVNIKYNPYLCIVSD